MFKIFSNFCDNKYVYKTLIYSAYDEYKSIYFNLKNKYPEHHDIGFMEINKYNTIPETMKKDMKTAAEKQKLVQDEIINLMKVYCKKYPDEKICHFCNWKTYDEYPYRLHQTIPEFISLL